MLDDEFEFWDISDDVYNAIRMAELAAEGAALRASARAALMHRVGLALLGASLLLGLAMLLVPALRPWYGQAPWVLVWGVVAYLVIAAIAYWTRPTTSAPELRRLRRIRHGIAALLHDLRTARGARQNPVLIRALTDAIDHLDEQLIPALQELVERRSNLKKQLARYERGELPTPEPGVLAQLQAIHRGQEAAIVECLQQAANAHATLVALLQEGDDARVAARARAWADDLTTLYEAVAEVLRGSEGDQGSDAVADVDTSAAPASEIVSEAEQVSRASGTDVIFIQQVDEALKRARDLGKLTGCTLVNRLPWTIAATLRERRNGHGGHPTSLERARVLGEVLRAAIDRLKPAEASGDQASGEMLRYHVLFELYIRGASIKQVMTRYGISEATLHRYRRQGVRVVAQELAEQEERYERDQPGAGAQPA